MKTGPKPRQCEWWFVPRGGKDLRQCREHRTRRQPEGGLYCAQHERKVGDARVDALAERAVRAGIEAQDCDACGGTGYHTDYSSAPVETSVPEDYAERVPCAKCDARAIAARVIAEESK